MRASDPETSIDAFEAFPGGVYEPLDLTGLAAYAIKRLQDLQFPATFENLVVALFRLFPEKFSLHGYAQYPDAARIGRTLLQLGPKYRNWARGSVQKGFTLTPSGLMKVEQVTNALTSIGPHIQPTRRQALPRTMDLNKDLSLLEESRLFGKWKDGDLAGAANTEVIDLLGAYAYSPPRALRGRVQFLENSAKQVGREDLLEFLQAIRREFASLFRE
jgi:hypothetical protein